MDLMGVVRDLAASGVVGVFLFFFFRHPARLSRRWAVISAILVAGLLESGLVSAMACRAYGLAQLRLMLTALTAGIAVVFYFCLAVAVVWVADIIWWAFTRPEPVSAKRAVSVSEDAPGDGSAKRLATRPWAVRAFTVVAVALSLMTTGYGYVEAQSPAVTDVTLSFPDLPSDFDQMTIALVVDLHISSMTRSSFLPMVVDQVNSAHPDLIVIAGDLVDGTVANLGERMSALKDLTAPYGVVVTLGNHETYSGAEQWSAYFDSLGLKVLTNDGILLRRGDQSITILGVADLKQTGAMAPDLSRAVDRVGSCEDAFCVLVAHEPAQVLSDDGLASRLGVDLQLSGHTHGGQMWPLKYLTRLSQPAVDGVHVIDQVTVVTSRGVGTFRPPVRVGADPEIPIITLTQSS